jgi:hypothetical protein
MALQLTARVENNALRVEFALRNPLDVDVYVDQFEPTRTWPPVRRGYVYVHREDRLLLLYFGTVPNPPLLRLAQEIKFYTERLPPGETLRRSITLRLPVVENGKVDQADPTAPHDVVNVDRVRCTVCYTPKERGPKILEVAPKSDLYEVWYGTARQAEANMPLLHPIPALRRSDDFDRPFDPARTIV